MSSAICGKRGLAIILGLIIYGLGHMYIGRIVRGLIILIAGFSIGFFALFFIPFPFSILPLIVFEIWQISDLILIIKRSNNKQTIP
jgi:TM2 domain-containing membrane protein YozV